MSGLSYTGECPRCGGDCMETSLESKPHNSVEGFCLECGFGYHTVCYLSTLEEVNKIREEAEECELGPLGELKKPASEWNDSDWIPSKQENEFAQKAHTATPITVFSGEHRFLSNFYPSEVCYDGEQYRTVEHAYQAAKAIKSDDRLRVRDASSPAQAKRLGRTILLRKHWEEVKVHVMLQLLRQKFSAPVLKGALLDTGNAQLIEGNNWSDTFWGVCNGVGTNVLGTLLMRVRDEIRQA